MSIPVLAAASTSRLPGIDILRFLAALSVTWRHSHEDPSLYHYHSLFTWTVPFFAAMVTYWMINHFRRNPDESFVSYFKKRLTRIAIPFYAWSILYFLARNVERLWITHKELLPFEWKHLWTGPTHHLWFLPFVILYSLVVFFPLQYANTRVRIKILLSLFVIPLGLLLALTPNPYPPENYLPHQVWRTFPPALWTIPLAYFLPRIPATIQKHLRWAGLLLLVLIFSTRLTPESTVLSNTILAIVLVFTAALPWQYPILAKLSPLGRLSYGIYLIHLFFIIAMRLICRKFIGMAPGFDVTIITFLGAAILSTLTVYLLTRHPLTRWLIPA